MPAQQPATGIARVVVKGTASGQSIVNVFHVRKGLGTAAWSQAELDALVTLMESQFKTAFASSLNSNYSGDVVEAQDLTSNIGLFASISNTCNGTMGGANVPQSACCCITWRINRHYRGGHPRTYLGPIGTTAIENAVSLASAYLTGLQTKASTFLTNVNIATPGGATCQLVTLHRVRGGAVLTPPEVSLITGVELDARIDSQRRRMGPDR